MYFGNLAHAEGQTEQALALFGLARSWIGKLHYGSC